MSKICIGCNKYERMKGTSYCTNCNKIRCRNWYDLNKEKKIIYIKNWQIKNNYLSEKTQLQRKIRNIKRTTREHYPLNDKFCDCCMTLGRGYIKATEHHHTTNPITIDDFVYVCHKCHVALHRNNLTNEKED